MNGDDDDNDGGGNAAAAAAAAAGVGDNEQPNLVNLADEEFGDDATSPAHRPWQSLGMCFNRRECQILL